MFALTQETVVQEEKKGSKLRLSSISVDYVSKKMRANFDIGNMVNAEFIKIGSVSHTIENVPSLHKSAVDTLPFTSGTMELSYIPTGNLKLCRGATVYNEGVDYSTSGNTITSISIGDGIDIDVTYTYDSPAVNDFDDAIIENFAQSQVYSVFAAAGLISGTAE